MNELLVEMLKENATNIEKIFLQYYIDNKHKNTLADLDTLSMVCEFNTKVLHNIRERIHEHRREYSVSSNSF